MKRFINSGFLILCILFVSLLSLSAQSLTVKGTVKDANTGEPLPGVNIIIQGTQTGVVTDLDGNYQIKLNKADDVLVFSYLGYNTENVTLGGRTVIDMLLIPDVTVLDEIVVTGYGGTARRSDLTGSIATISGEEMKQIPTANAAEALKGRMPGVNVLTTDGSPDAELVIRVRGGGSVTQDNSPLLVVDGFIVSSIRDIPTSDIANISVLKDAASTAIYGAQGANGVILVTTNKPTVGKTRVSYNGFLQFKSLPAERKLEVLSPYEYVMAQYEYAKLRSFTSTTDIDNFTRFYGNYQDLELYKYKKANDWQDEVFGNTKLSQMHNVSISGGSEKTSLNLSFTNNTDQGLMVGNDYTRNVINFKLNHEIAKSLIFEASARVTNTVVNGAGTSGSSQLRVKDLITSRPVNGVADELEIDLSNLTNEDDYQSFLLGFTNPLRLAEDDWRKRTTKSYVLNAGLEWAIFDNLRVKTVVYTENSFDERLRFYGPLTSRSKQEGSNLPLGTIDENLNIKYRWINTLMYTVKNLGEHELDFLLGQELSKSTGKESYMRSDLFRVSITPEEMFSNMQLGSPNGISTEAVFPLNANSFFGRVNYQFKNKLLLNATLRSDASSIFSKENRVGIFPAAAFGYKLSEENFLKSISAINELKVRISYGETGNNRIDRTATRFYFGPQTSNGPGMGTNDYNTFYAPTASTLYNPDLVWETTINRNAGLDFSLFNYRVTGALDLYYNTTKDLLVRTPISPVSGFNSQWQNVGTTSNKGIELDLNVKIIHRSDFELSANLNFGYNKSRIDDLGEVNEEFYQSNWASTDLKDRDDYYLKVGETIGLIYGYVTDGYYTEDDFALYEADKDLYHLKTATEGVYDDKQTLGVTSIRPGYLKLKNLNDDTLINSLDRQVIGSVLPKLIGGFGFNLFYKNFDASAFFNFSVGNDVYNSGKIQYNQYYRTTYGNVLSSMSMDKRYTYIDVDGSYTGTPGAVVTDLEQLRQMNAGKEIWSGPNSFGQATAVIHSWAVEDGSFLRLNQLTVGYTIPRKITSKIGMSQCRVYATGYNLWLWTKYSGYDPEVNTTRSDGYAILTPGLDYSSYPKSRSFSIGLNVNF
ncbi:MAG: TonB-dependent receptor [Bacteroidales bacterium]|nr:TonB-dependent receptor [Bacteroidales bacterium]